ncbi:hypothetical protein [Halomonas getboli]|uniref:hypothetical protein n=1 Tax=Halomonas getboli TaxID=2935862 RepID=UPI001FFF7FA3|nr:hypothetical protein [Halomonas getboli]MCK2183520.1 hypothetical protein [Halomonas getboli]
MNHRGPVIQRCRDTAAGIGTVLLLVVWAAGLLISACHSHQQRHTPRGPRR